MKDKSQLFNSTAPIRFFKNLEEPIPLNPKHAYKQKDSSSRLNSSMHYQSTIAAQKSSIRPSSATGMTSFNPETKQKFNI